jgi:hypothetical protein
MISYSLKLGRQAVTGFARQVEARVLANTGARPWDRDALDRRIVQDVRDGTGRVIDDEKDVGGYPG